MECILIRHGVLSLHASCVIRNGGAVCFSAPSGTGKSTRAEAWISAFHADLLSGDRPAIRMQEGQSKVYGVPWDGKEGIFLAKEAPLTAVLELRRSHRNTIVQLGKRAAERLLLSQCFIPMWDAVTGALAIRLIRRAAKVLPVLRAFSDRGEEAAVKLSESLDKSRERTEEVMDMRIKHGFTLTDMVGEKMVMPTGENMNNFGGAVVLNEVSAFLYEKLEKGISRNDLIEELLQTYEVDRATAERDTDELLQNFWEYGILEEDTP